MSTLDAGQIIVYRHKTDAGFTIPIYPQLRPLVEKLCSAQKTYCSDLFTIGQSRTSRTNRTLASDWDSHISRNARLRRMFITRAIERGEDVKIIAQWQGPPRRRTSLSSVPIHTSDQSTRSAWLQLHNSGRTRERYPDGSAGSMITVAVHAFNQKTDKTKKIGDIIFDGKTDQGEQPKRNLKLHSSQFSDASFTRARCASRQRTGTLDVVVVRGIPRFLCAL